MRARHVWRFLRLSFAFWVYGVANCNDGEPSLPFLFALSRRTCHLDTKSTLSTHPLATSNFRSQYPNSSIPSSIRNFLLAGFTSAVTLATPNQNDEVNSAPEVSAVVPAFSPVCSTTPSHRSPVLYASNRVARRYPASPPRTERPLNNHPPPPPFYLPSF